MLGRLTLERNKSSEKGGVPPKYKEDISQPRKKPAVHGAPKKNSDTGSAKRRPGVCLKIEEKDEKSFPSQYKYGGTQEAVH